jgi:hypothetical protein
MVSPLGLVLYCAGFEKNMLWIVPTVALELLDFAIAMATNVSLVYTVDCYRSCGRGGYCSAARV